MKRKSGRSKAKTVRKHSKDSSSVFPEYFWEDIKSGINDIYNRKRMEKAEFFKLYSHMFNYFENLHVKYDLNSLIIGHDLYNYISQILTEYLEDVYKDAQNLIENDLLNFYTSKWNNYRISSSILNGVCSYLNRYWVRRQRKEGHKEIYEFYQLAMIKWKDLVFTPLEIKVTLAVLKLIEEDRHGELINSCFISSVIHNYVDMGLNVENFDEESTRVDFSVYINSFEDIFIERTIEFYTQESSKLLSHNSLTEYMKKVEERLMDEEKRIKTYLHEYTYQRLLTTCEEILIENHLQKLQCEFKKLLDDHNIVDLARMYRLLSRIPNGLNEPLLVLEKYIINEGISALEKCADQAVTDPNMYVTKILKVYQKFKSLIEYSFNNDPVFFTVLDKTCFEFINNNAVTEAFKAKSKSPELLAKHCDLLLKKSNKNLEEDDLEEALTQAVIVFKYIEDKDVFQNYYSKFLAKRLINQTSASDDAEASMISKLKSCCGNQYTSKLRRMFQDVGLSKDLNEKFRKHLLSSSTTLNLDFHVQILTSGSWPLKQSISFKIPSELEKPLKRFGDFYASQYHGRKLNWMYDLCKGELYSTCFKNRYIFQASTMQITILLMFNSDLSYTVQQLQESTGIDMEFLIQTLQCLLKSKLLLCDEGTNLQPTSIISLFTGYINKKLKVNIYVPLKIQQNTDEQAIEDHIGEGRNIVIQAAMIRVMKMRKTLKHQQLVAEVLSQLRINFKPKISMIKKCIDILIEKEYLERQADERDVYNYLA